MANYGTVLQPKRLEPAPTKETGTCSIGEINWLIRIV